MNRSRLFFIAAEGIPFLFATALSIAAVWRLCGALWAFIPAALFVYLCLLFRDPRRDVPSSALGVLSPVDGKVMPAGEAMEGEPQRVVIRVNSFGAYTARAPVEGKVMDLSTAALTGPVSTAEPGLWLATDEGENVVLRFRGHRCGLAPHAFVDYGERVGQGQRCAYLRLTKLAELELPKDARVLVEPGQRVRAGEDVLAKLPGVK